MNDIARQIKALETASKKLRIAVEACSSSKAFDSDTSSNIDAVIVELAFIRGYCDARGSNGTGDAGPTASIKHGENLRRKIRKSLGYINP